MIDRKARNELAELLRGLASGLISNDEFEDSIPDSEDDAIYEVFYKGGWLLYSDLKEYKLKGRDALENVVRKEVVRWVLFLKSDFEYSWPKVSFMQRIMHAWTLGVFGTSYSKAWTSAGDIEMWPFLNQEQFNKAKEQSGYLGK